jgi:hypothetical protein
MPTAELWNGETIEWTGLNICFCTVCKDIFNSVAAFDKHIKNGVHDTTGMPRNSRGYLVTALNNQFQDVVNCKHCGTQLGEEDLNFVECPYCGEEDYDDGD